MGNVAIRTFLPERMAQYITETKKKNIWHSILLNRIKNVWYSITERHKGYDAVCH